jgi:hypothetical protein
VPLSSQRAYSSGARRAGLQQRTDQVSRHRAIDVSEGSPMRVSADPDRYRLRQHYVRASKADPSTAYSFAEQPTWRRAGCGLQTTSVCGSPCLTDSSPVQGPHKPRRAKKHHSLGFRERVSITPPSLVQSKRRTRRFPTRLEPQSSSSRAPLVTHSSALRSAVSDESAPETWLTV